VIDSINRDSPAYLLSINAWRTTIMERYGQNATFSPYVQLPVCDKSVISEISGDFTLPDYQPEIKKLLRVTANVLPASRYVGDRSAEFSGNVDYYVVYAGADNQIYCTPLTTEYKIDIPLDNADVSELVNTTGYAVICPDNVSGRVTSPRKLSIKCRLRTRARIFGDASLEDRFENSDGSLEVLYGVDKTARTLISMGEMLRISDEIVISGSGDDLRVVCADAKALVDEVTCSDGDVNCRGNLYLKLLMSREDDTAPYTITRKIPFSQVVATDGVSRGDEASARATVCEMGISVEEGRIAVDIGMLIECHTSRIESVKYVKDVYSTMYRVASEYKTLDFPSRERETNGNFTLSDSMTLEEAGILPSASIVDVAGSVYPEAYSFDGDRCIVSGRVRYDLLIENGGEYSSAVIELPFRYETVAPDGIATAGADALFSGEVISTRARLDGERIGIDSEISMNGCSFENAHTMILDSVSFGEEIGRSRGEYTICYPERDESLWSVAKRYGTPIKNVISANKLSDTANLDGKESLSGVKYLMI
jgi:hypothetical protein